MIVVIGQPEMMDRVAHARLAISIDAASGDINSPLQDKDLT
jgi:hypothetical protein